MTRGPGSELQVDEYNRWAEPLKVSVHRVVAADVDNLLESVTAIAFPHASTVQSDIDYRLVGDIYRFDASHSGQVVLETQWAIASAGGELVMPPRRTRYEALSSGSAEPGAMVASMNDVLAQFSRDIAKAMQDLLQKED